VQRHARLKHGVEPKMRTHGTLVKWNDDRGFGFVALPQSHEEVFVHISAFPRDGVRPRVGEIVSFEVRAGSDGRKRAEAVERPGGGRKASERGSKPPRTTRSNMVGSLLTGVAILAVGFVAYDWYLSRRSGFASPPASPVAETTGQTFRCDGRTHCSQMTSCAEARYFLKHCPGAQMDGDGDREPCEQQWCN
jgi:cold shock CspA family protein